MKRKKELLAQVERLLRNPPGVVKLEDIYRIRIGRREGQTIWIIDGGRAQRLLYPYFLAGGNDQRYLYNPETEIWIDNRMGVAELRYTILHELLERKLMREREWTYNRAHNAALALEEEARLRDEQLCARKEEATAARWAKLWRKSALKLGSVKRHSIYRAYYGKVGGMKVWLVDGSEVRRMLDGNFLYVGHDLAMPYIPPGEIWWDMHMSCEEAWYSLIGALAERKAMSEGQKAKHAERIGLVARWRERDRQTVLARKHEIELPPVRYGCRNRGQKVN